MRKAFLIPLAVLVFCAFGLSACDMGMSEPTGPDEQKQQEQNDNHKTFEESQAECEDSGGTLKPTDDPFQPYVCEGAGS